MIIPTVEKSNATVTITADTIEFEKAIDGCRVRLQELIRLGEQVNKVLATESEHGKITVDEQIAEIRTYIIEMIDGIANTVSPGDYAPDVATLVHAYCETFNL